MKSGDIGSEVVRDERTVAVENASYRWAYLVISFGLLANILYRSVAAGQSNWDLFALVIGGGLVGTAYQARHHILTRRSLVAFAITFGVSAVFGAAAALLLWIRASGH